MGVFIVRWNERDNHACGMSRCRRCEMNRELDKTKKALDKLSSEPFKPIRYRRDAPNPFNTTNEVIKLYHLYGSISRARSSFLEQYDAIVNYPEYWPDKDWQKRAQRVIDLLDTIYDASTPWYDSSIQTRHPRLIGNGPNAWLKCNEKEINKQNYILCESNDMADGTNG